MTKEDRKNAYLYCKLRDEQYALYSDYAKQHGMLMSELLVVNALFYAKEGLTQKEFCEKTFQLKQTVNLTVTKLLKQDFITLSEKKENRREKLVRMTEGGRAYYRKPITHITRAEDMAMAMFTQEEQKALVGLSRTFTDNLAELFGKEDDEDGIL